MGGTGSVGRGASMNLVVLLRENLTDVRVPLTLGACIAHIPYRWRPGIGRAYRRHRQDIRVYDGLRSGQRKKWIFRRVRNIVQYAIDTIPFYRVYYARQGFRLDDLDCFDDITRIPIIDKATLQEFDLDYRSAPTARYRVNTGGSSGSTLTLYVHPRHVANEWAHMHAVWDELGYDPSDLKLMFGGRSDVSSGVDYDWLRHSLAVDIYADFSLITEKLNAILKKHRISYLHGYPSALYDFALACERESPRFLASLKLNLRGAFLASEYPRSLYRQVVERVFGVPTLSFYGHTERCILAYERDTRYVYSPFQTYGYAEVRPSSDGTGSLIGTSYYNFASPLIRYDTKDQISDVVVRDSILSSFRISAGRVGEFILDRNRKRIPLTGLIFGRHHSLFDSCRHIQIYQPEPGEAVVLFVPLDRGECLDPADSFDARNVEIRFAFRMVDQPIRTVSGKVPLLVSDRDLQRCSQVLLGGDDG